MGRKPKKGIDYFPADVDMFQDRKIKRLLRSAGAKGFTIYIYLLTHIYRENGYFLEWDEDSVFDVADDLNFAENVVEESVNVCCSHGLFNKEMLTDMGVLTSESIQQRWQKIVTEAKRVDTEIIPEYLIENGKPVFLTEETDKPPEETPKNTEESTQSKVKESKVNNSHTARAREEGRHYKPSQLDPPETVEEVKKIGAMKAIPPEACEIYFNLRGVDNFMRTDHRGHWKPILNWHKDLRLLYSKGALEPKRNKSNNGSNNNTKSRGQKAAEFLMRPGS